MWNLNEAEKSEAKAALIPDRTVARAVLQIRPGGAGEGGWFKQSRAGDLMLDADFTIEAGPFARRHVFNNMMVTGNPTAVSITMRELRAIVEGHYDLHPDDMSPDAQAKRANASPETMQGMSCCIMVGIEPAKDGYEAKNTIKAVLTKADRQYLAPGQEPPAASPSAPQAPAAAWQAQAAPQAATAAPAPAPQPQPAPAPQPPAGGGYGWAQ